MSAITREKVARFAAILGKAGIETDAFALAPWLTDWRGVYRGAAAAMLMPASVEEAAAVISLARELRVPLVPQGGNTGMVGGATPPADGSALILSARRMNRIRSLDADAGIAVAEAGVILSQLHEAAEARGLRFPLSLAAKGSATIGGLVSTNAGGTQVLRFGTMRNLVLGLEAVLPDGSVHQGLSILRKDNRGYNIDQLLAGAEGTLGFVTAAALKLVPDISARAVAWIGLGSPQTALKLLRFLEERTGDHIESFELIPETGLELVLRHIPGTRRPLERVHDWYVLVEYVETAPGADPQESLAAAIGAALEQGLLQDAAVSASEAQAEAFWKLRETLSEAARAEGPAVQHDISVPVDAMPDFMIHAAREMERRFPGTLADGFGHLGDGNIHFHVRAPAGADGAEWRANEGKAISSAVHDLVVAAGGSISAEHGIGQAKLGELVRLSPPSRLMALRAIKNAFDPEGIMNPGKLVPLASSAPDA